MKKTAIVASSFSENGSKSLAKLLTTKYSCTIIKNPEYDSDRGMWMITYINPTLEIKNESKDTKNERTNKSTRKNKNKRTIRPPIG